MTAVKRDAFVRDEALSPLITLKILRKYSACVGTTPQLCPHMSSIPVITIVAGESSCDFNGVLVRGKNPRPRCSACWPFILWVKIHLEP